MSFLISLLIKLNLAKKHRKNYIILKKSHFGESILKLLFKKNLIKTYLFTKKFFIVFLKYNYTEPLVKNAKIISKSGKRIYISHYKLMSLVYKNRTTFYFLSTTNGLLEGKDALSLNIGGELLFQITL
jgi:ribosomal protein S8